MSASSDRQAITTAVDPNSAAALEVQHLTKRFGTFTADDDVNLRLDRGEVHALVGENGAGKSTLMNMCFGIVQPTSGTILVNGTPTVIPSPIAAREHGIGMVHQHFKLVPSLTVAENVFLGAEVTGRSGTLKMPEMITGLTEVSERYGLLVDPNATVSDLSAGIRQRVEILKALYFDAKVLILDEPTAVLTPQETDRLLQVLRDLAAADRSVLLVTHKLREVMAVADRFSVLRRGRIVATGVPSRSSEQEIAALMVGRDVSLARTTPIPTGPSPDRILLQANGISVTGGHGKAAVDGVQLDLRAGEITGIAGVEGNGQTELVEALAGLLPTIGGTLAMLGADVTGQSAEQLRKRGLAHIPEDRLASGAAASLPIQENLVGGRLRSNLFPGGRYRTKLAKSWTNGLIEHYDIRGAHPGKAIGSLSGGNMQKVIVARELDSQPAVVLAAQPTRGVDIGASEFIHGQLRVLKDDGAAILLVSVELDELLALADRILVMYRGAIVAEFRPDEELLPRIGLAMAGNPDPRDLITAADTPPTATTRPAVPATAKAQQVVTPRPTTGATTASLDPSGSGRILERVAKAVSQPLTAVIAALVIGLVVIAAIGDDPFAAYRSLLLDTFSNQANFSAAIAQATPLLLVAVSSYVAFRAGILNIGGEGQLYLGAFVSAVVAIYLPDSLPGPLLIIISLITGGLAGAVWALIPALLNAYLNVDILVSTLMFSYIATFVTAYFVDGPLHDPTTGVPSTVQLPGKAALPTILGDGGANIGILIGLGLLIVIGLLLMRTRWGLTSRFVGENQQFARYLGVDVKAKVIQVMLVSGFLAGVAGAIATLGTEHRFNQSFSPGYGFIGLTVALLGRLNPIGIALAALLYGALEAGSTLMQLETGVPLALVNLLQGIIVILTTATVIRLGKRSNPLRSLLSPKKVQAEEAGK